MASIRGHREAGEHIFLLTDSAFSVSYIPNRHLPHRTVSQPPRISTQPATWLSRLYSPCPHRLLPLLLFYLRSEKRHGHSEATTHSRSLQRHLPPPRPRQLPFKFFRLRSRHGRSSCQTSRARTQSGHHVDVLQRRHLAESSHHPFRVLRQHRPGLPRQVLHLPQIFFHHLEPLLHHPCQFLRLLPTILHL